MTSKQNILDIPPIAGIPQMITEQAEKIPDAVAFRFRKGRDQVESRTFRQVADQVKMTASFLAERYGREKHIAVIGENSYEWLIAYFAILSSGNAAVPIDKALPANEIEWMLDKAEARAVLISPTYEDLVRETEAREVISLKKLMGMQGADWERFAPVSPAPDDLACILFTSGTSGRSKGVMLTHGNYGSDISLAAQVVDIRGKNSVAVLPFHHAFGLTAGVLAPYHVGVEVFLNKSLKKVTEDLQAEKPRLLFLVPLFIEEFYRRINEGIRKSGREKKVRLGLRLSGILLKIGIDVRRRMFREILEAFGGRLDTIVCGGARLDPFYQKAFRQFGIEVLNGYGASECAPVISVEGVRGKRDGSVGMPLPGVEVKISPEDEVLVRGPIVMPGYYHDPEETAAALQDGWYRTGDLGRLDGDGFLFLTGRKKNLIILSNGENISPEELENDFERDPAVQAVMVYDQGQSLVAEIYPVEEYRGNAAYFDGLMKQVNEGRPAYKRINRIVLREEDFIRNTTQKIVRYKNIPRA